MSKFCPNCKNRETYGSVVKLEHLVYIGSVTQFLCLVAQMERFKSTVKDVLSKIDAAGSSSFQIKGIRKPETFYMSTGFLRTPFNCNWISTKELAIMASAELGAT